MAATEICQRAVMFLQGKSGMRECNTLLENLNSIRICSRDPGQHILLKQGLVGVGDDPFATVYSWQ